MGHFLSTHYNIFGLVGVLFVLGTYFLLQIGRIESKSFWYSFLNFLGAILILISLYYKWNLASGVIEVVWLLISVYGIWRYWSSRRQS